MDRNKMDFGVISEKCVVKLSCQPVGEEGGGADHSVLPPVGIRGREDAHYMCNSRLARPIQIKR